MMHNRPLGTGQNTSSQQLTFSFVNASNYRSLLGVSYPIGLIFPHHQSMLDWTVKESVLIGCSAQRLWLDKNDWWCLATPRIGQVKDTSAKTWFLTWHQCWCHNESCLLTSDFHHAWDFLGLEICPQENHMRVGLMADFMGAVWPWQYVTCRRYVSALWWTDAPGIGLCS